MYDSRQADKEEYDDVHKDAVAMAIHSTPRWALSAFGVLFFFAIYMVFTGTNAAFNRVINAYALKVEASADKSTARLDQAANKMEEAVARLELRLSDAAVKMEAATVRISALENNLYRAQTIILDHETRLSGLEGRYYGRARSTRKKEQ